MSFDERRVLLVCPWNYERYNSEQQVRQWTLLEMSVTTGAVIKTSTLPSSYYY